MTFEQIPDFPIDRIAIKLKPAAERMVKKGHPWVFEASIQSQNKEGKAGDLAIIFDQKKNKFLACGLYDPNSPIRIKLLQFHQSAQINEAWFLDKITTAFKKRKPLLETETNSYRFIYGENDGLPGFIADVYNHVLVVKIYSEIWFPQLKKILPHLIQQSACTSCVLRLSRLVQKNANALNLKDGQVLLGTLEKENILFKEHGVQFMANVIKGHKTGFFLDHRYNRNHLGGLAKDKTVLDVFSYAGGFSVHALVGGAKEVTSVDISAQALVLAEENAALNTYEGKHKTIANDAFVVLEDLIKKRKQFDLVIIDPPSFAKQSKEVDKAKTQYQRLANLGARLVASNGILFLASCSSRVTADAFFEINETTFEKMGSSFQLIKKTFHDIDHPIGFSEGAYLKAGYYQRLK